MAELPLGCICSKSSMMIQKWIVTLSSQHCVSILHWCLTVISLCTCHLLGSRAGGSPTHVPAEEIPEQAEGSDVNLDPQPATSNGDASTQEGEPTVDLEPTTSSSTLVPERSQEAQKYEEAKPVINPFLLTASYLVDVHASKVGLNWGFLFFVLFGYGWI